MRLMCLAVVLMLGLVVLPGCARHTYLVELNNGNTYYVDPPLILDKQAGVYTMKVNGQRRVVALDEVRYIDDAAQICYQNPYTDMYTCFDALYQF